MINLKYVGEKVRTVIGDKIIGRKVGRSSCALFSFSTPRLKDYPIRLSIKDMMIWVKRKFLSKVLSFVKNVAENTKKKENANVVEI